MNETCRWFHLWPAGCTNPTDLEVLRDLYWGKLLSEIPVLQTRSVTQGCKGTFQGHDSLGQSPRHWPLFCCVPESPVLFWNNCSRSNQTRGTWCIHQTQEHLLLSNDNALSKSLVVSRHHLSYLTNSPWELFDTFAFLFGFERGSHCVAHFPTRDNYPAPTFQMLADTPGFVCVWHFLTHRVDLENIKFWLQIPPLFLRKRKAATNVETLNIMEFWQRTGPKVSKNGHSRPLPSWE